MISLECLPSAIADWISPISVRIRRATFVDAPDLARMTTTDLANLRSFIIMTAELEAGFAAVLRTAREFADNLSQPLSSPSQLTEVRANAERELEHLCALLREAKPSERANLLRIGW